LVTHDLEAAAVADRRCTLRDGKLSESAADFPAREPAASYPDSREG